MSLERAFLALNRWLLVLMLAAMALIVFANVGLRYLTNASIPWAEEVARHLMIWLTFLGAGPVLRAGGHIAIDSLQDVLPAGVARAARLLIVALLAAFFGLMVVVGWAYMQRARGQMTAATQISFAWIYAAIPVGGAVLLAHLALIVRGYVGERVFKADAQFDATASASI